MIHIFLIQFFPEQLNRLTESLEMNHFPFTQELDHIIHIRIVGQPKDIVVGHPGFLLGSQVFRQIGHGIALDLHGECVPGSTGSGSGVDPGGMIHKIRRESAVLNLTVLQIPGQLMDDGPDHF